MATDIQFFMFSSTSVWGSAQGLHRYLDQACVTADKIIQITHVDTASCAWFEWPEGKPLPPYPKHGHGPKPEGRISW